MTSIEQSPADITVKNPSLGVVEIDLVEFGRGEWSYHIVRVNGDFVNDGPDAEPMPKREAEKRARRFGRECRYVRGLGYCH